MATEANGMGWLGWFSALGFVVLGLLAIFESTMTLDWPLSVTVTAGIAILAGLGAVLFYVGNDPTAERTVRHT